MARNCRSYLQQSTPTFFILTVTEAEPPSGSEPKSTLEGTSWKPLGGTWEPLRNVNRQLRRTGPSTDRNWNRNRSHGVSPNSGERNAAGEVGVARRRGLPSGWAQSERWS